MLEEAEPVPEPAPSRIEPGPGEPERRLRCEEHVLPDGRYLLAFSLDA